MLHRRGEGGWDQGEGQDRGGCALLVAGPGGPGEVRASDSGLLVLCL